jgi:hypothetical protein
MTRRPAVEVQGLRTLRRELKRAGASMQDLKDAHNDVAQHVVRAAAPGAPRRTGRLAGTQRGCGTQSAAVVRAGGAATPYAGPIHWGWPARHVKAQPWLYDAATRTQDTWTGIYLSALEKIIDKIQGAPGP